MAERTCSFPGCEEPTHSRGWCGTHYQRWRRHGDPAAIVSPRRSEWAPRGTPLEERFWAKVNKAGPVPECRPDLGPCWLWTAGRNKNGYGTFAITHRHMRRMVRAPRFAYELLVSPIPQGLPLDHLCRNPPCVRPSHLEPVTHRENLLRGIGFTATRAAQTHCKRGHEFTEANTYHPRKRPNGRVCRQCRRDRRALARQLAGPVAFGRP
jgi:hypothetical protein